MAEKQFIKMYTVNKKDFNDNGELKPDAPLYPFYSGIYGMKSQEKFGEPAVYDNENNIHPLRRVLLTDRSNAAEGVFDAPTYKIVGPNMKRGFSVNSYAGPYKRSTDPDKMNEFDDWTKDPVDIPKDAPDEIAHILEENRLNRSTLYPTMKFTMHPTDEDEDRKLWRRDQVNAFGPDGEIGEYFKYKTGDYTPRGSDDEFVRIPMIVTADDSDIVTIDDVLNDNYEPLRDYKNEEHIKKINARKLPSGLIVPSGTVTKDDIKKAKDFYKYMWNELNKFIIDASSKELRSNFYKNVHLCTENKHFDLEELFGYVTEVRMKLQDTFDTVNPYTGIDELLALSQESVNVATGMIDKYIRKSSDKDIKPTWGMYNEYILAHDYVRRALYILEEFITEQTANKSNITVNRDIWNNIQDWFAYDNPDTSSDERIKDIHKCLSDEGCTDVTLSDSQMQQVKDDFNNWLKSRENHANICDGLKELGQ